MALFNIFKLKITNILKSSEWGLEKSELPWEQNFFIAIGVFPVELSACQVSMFSALQIGQDSSIYILNIVLGGVYDIISHLICIF